MSSSCAVQGVVKLKREYLDEMHGLYQTPDQGFCNENFDIACYLFGINVSRNIETHFSETAANGSFDEADFETGYLTFVSGFNANHLHDLIEKVEVISDHYILYCIFENPSQLHNEKVVIKNLKDLKEYLPKFNNPSFIESDIPFDEFDKDGTYYNVETECFGNNPFSGIMTESAWKFAG